MLDGVLTDVQETKDALVRASDLPLSILIVRVGDADFKQMEMLDADDGRRLESSTGRIATRDIVQFVPMREVHGKSCSTSTSLTFLSKTLGCIFAEFLQDGGLKLKNPPSHPPKLNGQKDSNVARAALDYVT